MCRSADPSICVAPAPDFLKQPTFCVIKIGKYLLQLQFKINSETMTFPMFLPRLADPVPGCFSLSTGLLILSQAPALCLQVGDEDEIWCTPPVTCKFCGNETFLCCKS